MSQLIVFIHGIGSSSKAWNQFINVLKTDTDTQDFQEYHPNNNKVKNDKIYFYLYQYESNKFNRFLPYKWLYKKMTGKIHNSDLSLDALSDAFKGELINLSGNFEKLHIVAHSMGGVMTMSILTQLFKEDNSDTNLTNKLNKILLYGSPLKGSDEPKTIQNILTRKFPSQTLLDLKTNSNIIRRLSEKISNHSTALKSKFQIKYIAGYDSRIIPLTEEYVNNFGSFKQINGGHSKIIQPKTSSDSSFGNFKKFISTPFLAGCIPITFDQPVTNKTHNKYLSNDNLPYISRSHYQEVTNTKDFETEKTLYTQIFNKKDFHGLIISGEGGIGKTRLMLEIAELARKEDWLIYEINFNIENFNEITLIEGYKYCFIFDYIEESLIFDISEIRQFIEKYRDNTQIRIIANARNISKDDRRINDYYNDFVRFEINTSDPHEQRYIEFVIQKMFSKYDILDLPASLLTKPSFAVFILDDLNNNRNTIKSLRQNQNGFKGYLTDRLTRTLKISSNQNIPNVVYHLFASLSMQKPSNDEEQLQTYLSNLEAEGWIKYEDNKYHSAHNDTITDLLLEYHFKDVRNANIDSTLQEYFHFGTEHQTIGKIIRSFERANIEKLSHSFYTFFSANLNNLSEYTDDIIRTTSLNEEDRIQLIYNNQENLPAFKTLVEEKFIPILGTAMRKLSSDSQSVIITEIYNKWQKTIDCYLYSEPVGAYIIEAHILYFGIDDFISEKLAQWNATYKANMPKETSYIVQALERQIDCQDLHALQLIKYWNESLINRLKDNFGSEVFTHLAESYLKQKLQTIPQIIIDWINKYPTHKNASYVIQPYFANNGELTPIENAVVQWINNTGKNSPYLPLVIEPFLDKGGNVSEIEDTIKNWINTNSDNENASFAIKPYLNKSNDLESIRPNVIHWINKYPTHKNASYVIQPYFANNGELTPIKNAVVQWINTNYDQENANHIIQSFLNRRNGGELNSIENSIIKWINMYSPQNYCGGVIKSYLQCEGSVKEIEPACISWIKLNNNINNTNFYGGVMKAYLKSKGTLTEIEPDCTSWINTDTNFQNDTELYVRVVKYYLESGGTYQNIRTAITNFAKNLKDENAKNSFEYLKQYLQSKNIL